MQDQYTEERRHTKLTTGEKCLIAIPFFLLLFVLWFMVVIGMIGIERTYHRTKLPSGIEGCRVWLGSTLEEVYSIMGEPDSAWGERYEALLDSRNGHVTYLNQTLFGKNTAIGFTFDRNLEEENARVILISTTFSFSEEDACSNAAQELQEYFHNAYADDKEFSEHIQYAPIPIRFDDDLVSEYRMSTSRLVVAVIQYSSRIYVETRFHRAYTGLAANETRSFQNIAGIVIILTVLLLIAVFFADSGQKNPAAERESGMLAEGKEP